MSDNAEQEELPYTSSSAWTSSEGGSDQDRFDISAFQTQQLPFSRSIQETHDLLGQIPRHRQLERQIRQMDRALAQQNRRIEMSRRLFRILMAENRNNPARQAEIREQMNFIHEDIAIRNDLRRERVRVGRRLLELDNTVWS